MKASIKSGFLFYSLAIGIGLIIFGMTRYIQHSTKYRETTPQERTEFDSTRAQFIKDHMTVEVRITTDSLIVNKPR